MSHPIWMCGLKSEVTLEMNENLRSHPIWMCGLKCIYQRSDYPFLIVTSYMDVWIEILKRLFNQVKPPCHILYGCVD